MLPPQPLSPGSVFQNQFRVLESRSQGAYVARYVVERLGSRDTCFLDLLSAPVVPGAAFRDRFVREVLESAQRDGAGAASAIAGKVVGAGIDDGAPWIAFERVDAVDLGAVGALTPDEVLAVLAQIGQGLSTAHAAARAHGGLRPEVVLLGKTAWNAPLVRLVHFGVAPILAEARSAIAPSAPRLDPAWAAPEQLAGLPAAPAADLWALGLVAFRALVGVPFWKHCGFGSADRTAPLPVAGTESTNLVREVTRDPIPPAAARATELGRGERVPQGFSAWFARCVVRNPEERYASVEQAIAELGPALGVGPGRTSATFASVAPVAVPAGAPPQASYTRSHTPTAGAWQQPSTGARTAGLSAGLVALGAAVLGGVAVLGVGAALAVHGVHSYQQKSVAARVAQEEAARAVEQQIAAKQAEEQEQEEQARQAAGDANEVFRVPVGASPARGSTDALVTVVEFGDFECPFTKRVEPTVAKLRDTYGTKVRIVWKNEPLAFHPHARAAAELAMEVRAKKGDDAFWAVHDQLLATSSFEDDALARVADASGVSGKRRDATIDDDEKLAADVKAAGTPVFFVNGKKLNGAQPFEAFKKLVDQELVKAQHLADEGVPARAVYDTILANDAPAIDVTDLPKAGAPGTATPSSLGAAPREGSREARSAVAAPAPAGGNAASAPNAAAPAAAAPSPAAAAPAASAGGGRLVVKDLAAGGGPAAKPGNVLTVRYVGKLDGGAVYDTKHKVVPFTFTLGKGQVTRGWEQGLVGMRPGGKRRLVVPPQLAYGERGIPGTVPPNATLVYDIELLFVE